MVALYQCTCKCGDVVESYKMYMLASQERKGKMYLGTNFVYLVGNVLSVSVGPFGGQIAFVKIKPSDQLFADQHCPSAKFVHGRL